MRTITEIIIHCSATPEGRDFTVAHIDRWHRQRGWSGIGYHYVVRPDGTVQEGRPLARAGAHCQGHNAHSIGICYIGGLDARGRPKDTRTPAQKQALRGLVDRLLRQFPGATVHAHNEYAPKACPCFGAGEL
ncbi:MAG: N-acetylmuramoyl-L-alanine amidase [Bacteroidaceae bacterium]